MSVKDESIFHTHTSSELAQDYGTSVFEVMKSDIESRWSCWSPETRDDWINDFLELVPCRRGHDLTKVELVVTVGGPSCRVVVDWEGDWWVECFWGSGEFWKQGVSGSAAELWEWLLDVLEGWFDD